MKNPHLYAGWLKIVTPAILITAAAGAGLAFTPSATSTSGKNIVGEGERVQELPRHSIKLLYNENAPAHIFYRALHETAEPAQPWQSISVLPAIASDASNQLELYDADASSRPLGKNYDNICGIGGIAKIGKWQAQIDEAGQVFLWFMTESDTETDVSPDANKRNQNRVHIAGLPPASTIALGVNHAVAFSQTGEVWTWDFKTEYFPTGLAPPVKLDELPAIKAIGAWREWHSKHSNRRSLDMAGSGSKCG